MSDTPYLSTDPLTGINAYNVEAMTETDIDAIRGDFTNLWDDEGLEVAIAEWVSFDGSRAALVEDQRAEPESAHYQLAVLEPRQEWRYSTVRADNWREAIREAQSQALEVLSPQQDLGMGL